MTCDVLVFNIRRVNNATTHAMHKVTNSDDSPSSKSHVLPPCTAAPAAAAAPFPTLSSSAASIVPDRTRMRPPSPGGSLLRIPPDTTKERGEDSYAADSFRYQYQQSNSSAIVYVEQACVRASSIFESWWGAEKSILHFRQRHFVVDVADRWASDDGQTDRAKSGKVLKSVKSSREREIWAVNHSKCRSRSS